MGPKCGSASSFSLNSMLNNRNWIPGAIYANYVPHVEKIRLEAVPLERIT
jgi:hypothetical protein